MNKIFKVVWSKTKECYVVVSEVAKNNGGKKKVLASVLAGLAMVGAGAQVQAYSDLGGHDNPAVETLAVGPDTWANQEAAVAVGMHNNANGQPAGKHSVAIGSFSNANGEISIAMGGVTNASGKMSVAVGYRASATDEAAVALGNMVSADKNSTGVGPGATASGTYAFAGGYQSETTGISGVAIGDNAKAKAARAMAIGGHAEATAEQAIAIGSDTGAGTATTNKKTTASGKNAIAVGNGSKATTNDSLAMGSSAEAAGLNASAVGKNSKASGQSAAAFGDSAQATNTNATAVGNKANASNTNTTAIGNQTVASGGNATAVGHLSQATDDGATAIGTNNKAGYEGTAVGLSNTVTGRTSAAFGRSNTVSGNESLAAGIRSTASGERNVAIGYQAVTNNKATVAIGEGSKADIADGVAIGSNSATTAAAGVQGFNPADSRTNTYGGLTGTAQTSTLGAVAVGNGDTATRQITGLAAGKENTDAVNVAQLRSVNLKYAADTGNSDLLLTDGTLTVKGDNDLISTSVVAAGADKGTVRITAKVGGTIDNTDGKAVKPTTNGIATTDNVADAINKSYWKATAGGNTDGTPTVGNVKPGTQVTYSAGDNLKVKQSINATTGDQEYKYSLNPVLTGITSISNATTGPKMTFGGNSINITGGSLDMGTNKIINLAPGTADNDAVNVKQLKDTELHITPGTYTPDASKKVKLTYTNGNNTVVTGKEAIIDLSGLATGGTASTEKVQKAADAANDTNIAEVNPKTGDTFGGAGATYEVSVSRNAVKDAAREAVTVNNGGTTTGGTYTADTNNPISVTAKPDNTNHNTTYEVTFDGNKAAKQIPLTYKATNGTTTTADQTVKLDKGLNFTGGDYTTASVGADGKVTFDVNLGTVPTVTDGKPGVPGQAGAAGKDGIATVKTVVDTINNSGWKANAKANGGTLVGNSTATVVKPGDQVNFAAGKNLTVKQDLTGEHTYTYSLNKDVDLTNAGSLTVGDTKVNNDGITIKAPTPVAGTTPTTDVKLTNTGLDNGGNKIVNVAEGTADTDAVNVKQLKDAKTVLADGKNTKKSGTGTAADPYKVNVEGDLTGISSITNGGTNNGKISFGPNKTVTVDGDHSITLNASTGKIGGLQNLTFDPTNFTSGQAATEDQLKSVHDTLKASELHIAPTESNRTGEHIAGAATSNTAAGAAANAYKYDATTKQVVLEYNDGTGANKTGTKAVIDFSALNTGAGASSWNIASDKVSTTEGTVAAGSAATQNIADGKTVTMKAGKNLTVKQENVGGNASVAFSLDKDLKDLDSVTTNKTITKEITLKDPNGGTTSTTIKKDGDRITYTNDGSTTVNKVANLADEKHITPGTYSVDNTGKVTMTYTDGNGGLVPNTTTVIDGLVTKKLDNIDNDGKKTITGLGTIVKAGDNVTVSEASDTTTGQKTYTVNAVTPAVYTKADGTKVVKRPNGTYTTNLDGSAGNDVSASDVIISFQDAAGDTKNATSIVNNVGSAIKNQTGGDFLTKLDNANTATPNAAVNVSDLKNTADGLTNKGLKFDANSGGVKTNKLGSTVKVQGAGTSADANYSGANIKTFIDQDTAGNTTIDVKLDKNLTGINSISNTTTGPKMEFGGSSINITGGSLNMGGSNITNLKSGIVNNNANDDTNAANIGDVKTIAKDTDLHIAPTAGTTNNVAEYTVDANNKVTLTYQDGNGAAQSGPKAVIDLSALANKITSGYTFNTNAIAKGGTVDGSASVKAVDNGGTINYAAGKNLTVKQEIDATAKTHTYTYSLNKDLTNLDKVVVNGENGTNGKDGVTIIGPQGATGATGMPGTNGIDGKVGITGKDGKDAVSISGKDGIGTIGLTGPQGPAGQDGRGVDITTDHGTQTLNKPEANNNNQSERIVYVPKDKDGNPLKDDAGNTIKREVATMDDGLKFAGDDGQANQATNANVIKKQLNNVVDIIGGATKADLTTNNIGVNNDGNGKLLVQLSKNLNGINTVKNGNTTITLNDAPGGATNTPAVTISGGNLSMGDGTHNNKIVNVAPGTDDSDAVNYKQLKAAKTEVKAGKNVVVTSETSTTDGHTTYTVNASTPAVYTKPDGTKLVKQPDGTFKDENGNAYTGSVIASFEDGTGATTGGNMIVNNIGSAIKTQTGGDFLTKLDNANTATPNAAVNVSDLKSTADALKANERHIAPTTVATGSTETKGGTANAGGTANVYKYDAASKTVTLTYNDGNGNAVTDTKAVIDLSNLSTGGTGASSWNVKSSANTTDGGAVDVNHNANAQNIADGKSVEFQSGKNLVVKQTNDTTNGNATVEFSLSDNITVGKDGANGKDGSVGAKGADGSAVVMNGKDGSIGLNGTNGANGISIKGKDGANGVGIDGQDGVTRIVYTEKVPDPAHPGTTKEVTHEVATMDDGLKFTGNNTGTVNKHKLGSLVKVQGEGVSAADEAAFVSASGNIAVTAENNDTLTIRLNKNLKGLNSIQLGGNTIQSNGDNITFTTNGGTTKTVATTDQLWTIQANGTDVPATNGKVNVVGKDGITVAKNAAGNLEISGAGLGTMNGFDVTANNGATSKTIDNGKKVDFNAGSNLTVKQTNDATGTHIEYALKEAVDLGTNGSLKAGDTTVNKDGVTIANGPSITKTGVDAGDKKITNVADGAVNATSKDAVNGSQLKKYTDAAKTTVEAGDDNVKVETDNSAADGHTNYKVSLKPVVEIGDTHKVKIDGHTGDITGLTNVDLTDPTFATKGRAATEEQLNKVLTEAKKKAVEKVQAGTAAAGDTNIATVAPKAGDTFGAAGATYEVSVSKNAVKDAAKEAVKVTSASPAITVTPDTSVAHETTYKVGFDGDQAATQIPLTYKQNGGSARTVKLSDGLNFIDGTNTKARTAADGKVTFDVMGDLTGITSISNAAGGPKMTFGGNSINVTNGDLNMGGNKITNLGKGTATTDAATVGQLTKVTSNNHSVVINKTTDANGAPVYDLAVTGTPGAPAVDPRIDQLGEEIGRVGAQGAALSALKPIQYDPLEPTQIMAGYGNYRGNSAVALGVAHYKNESTLIHGGVSWAGGSSHMMANAGVTWKVGNRDSEAAVADRYRKGPISSAYAMQQEMAAMKAQNAGLKGEVSDLKAENEQMKAQIAAMMAKLGL